MPEPSQRRIFRLPPFSRRTRPLTSTATVKSPRYTSRFELSGPGARHVGSFAIDPQVAHRFNAFARAAFPREIGGMLRIVDDGAGGYRAVDLRVFTHVAASGSYFELDGVEVAKFLGSLLREGRKDEIAQWRGLVHSHPGFGPSPSTTDIENLRRLAGSAAWSVICSAWPEPARNYYAVHYAQAAPWPLVLTNLRPDQPERELAGLGSLTDNELGAIETAVDAVLPKRTPQHSWRGFDDEPWDPWAPRSATSTLMPGSTLLLSDEEYELIDDAISEALDDADADVPGLEELRHTVDLDLPLSDEQRDLLTRTLRDHTAGFDVDDRDFEARLLTELIARIE